MALTDDELTAIKRLRARLDRDSRDRRWNGHRVPGMRSLKAYYAGLQRLEQLGIAVPDDLRDFVTIVAWPRTYVDAITARLYPQGFMVDGQVNTELWRIWQINNLDTEIKMAFRDMLRYRRGYLAVGARGEDDPNPNADAPLITVESPLQMVHEWSNRFRRVTAAARFYVDDAVTPRERRVTLLLPDTTVWAIMHRGRWVEDERDDHEVGRVMVHPLVNRADTDDRYGESEMQPVIQLTDAAARALTDAQVATEVAAIPQRWAAGMTKEDFKDPKTQEMLTQWEAYFGSVWASAKEDAKFGQFSAADLQNFKTIVSLYAEQVAGLTGLSLRHLGQNSDNPPSADAIRADEGRIIGTSEDKQALADEALEGAMRDAHYLHTGTDDESLLQMETWWRSAATPSLAQSSDAAVKKYQAGLVSKRQARRDMGYTPQQIETMEDEDALEREDPLLSEFLRQARVDANAGAGA